MRRARRIAGLLLSAIAAGCGSDGGEDGRERSPSKPRPQTGGVPPAPARPADPLAAVLRRPVVLRAAPGGRRIARLGLRTEFGSQQVLRVVAERGAWLAVLAPELPNGRAGWIPAAAADLRSEPWSVRISLSKRLLVTRLHGRVRHRFRIAVGAPSTPTPRGRFAVTDRLTVAPGSPYGCCVLALSGRQPAIPQGWGGGDRLAIHGTSAPSSIGKAVSNGCLRAPDRAMRTLLRHIPLGAPVTIGR